MLHFKDCPVLRLYPELDVDEGRYSVFAGPPLPAHFHSGRAAMEKCMYVLNWLVLQQESTL